MGASNAKLHVDSGLDPGERSRWHLGRRHFLAIPGPRFWRTLSVYTHLEPVLALLGGISHLPLTQGDGVGVPLDLLFTDPLGEAL